MWYRTSLAVAPLADKAANADLGLSGEERVAAGLVGNDRDDGDGGPPGPSEPLGPLTLLGLLVLPRPQGKLDTSCVALTVGYNGGQLGPGGI